MHITSENDAESGSVILFKETTLQKCHDVYAARSKMNSKWSKVVLPKVLDDINGYHSLCYRRFTAVESSKFLEELNVNDDAENDDVQQQETQVEAGLMQINSN